MRRAGVRVVGALFVCAVFFAAFQVVNAELGGEVVVLATVEPDGGIRRSRLWVADHGEAAWVRARSFDSTWLLNVRSRPEVELVRGGETLRMRAVVEPAAVARVGELMREAYGLNECLRLSVLLRRGPGIPVRLERVSPSLPSGGGAAAPGGEG